MASNKKRFDISLFFRELLTCNFLYFLVPFTVFILAGALSGLFFAKGDLVLAVNSQSNENLDSFFLLVTNLGLGSFVAIIGVVFLFHRFRWSILVFINLAWVGIWTYLFKKVFFPMTSRPFHYFYYDDFSRFLFDAPLSYYNSFPSGHTMTIFALCGLLAFIVNRKIPAILFFMLACVVALSRIYLLQHFFIDAYFGALLGMFSVFLTLWIDKRFDFKNKSILNKNLILLFRKKKF